MAKKKTETNSKFISAGIGAVAAVQTAVEEGFDTLVAKGIVARKDYRASIDKFRSDVHGDVKKQFNSIRGRVVSTYEKNAPVKIEDVRARVEKVTDRVTARASNIFNIPTSKDIDELNKKLDKVIRKVAA